MNDNGGCVLKKRSLAIRSERLIHECAYFFLLIFKGKKSCTHGFPFRNVNETLNCIIFLGGVL